MDCKTRRQTILETLNQSSETSMVQYRYDPGTNNDLDKLWSRFVLNVLEKSIERKERPDMYGEAKIILLKKYPRVIWQHCANRLILKTRFFFFFIVAPGHLNSNSK